MLWDSSKNAGFSDGEPWLPVSEKYLAKNVDTQRVDPNSLLNFYKEILQLRNANEVLKQGDLRIDEDLSNGNIFAYWRELEGRKLLIALNFSKRKVALRPMDGKVLISTTTDREQGFLLPYQGMVIEVTDEK